MSASTALARTARSSAFEIVRENFQKANAFLRLPSDLAVMLTTPQRELKTEIPLMSEDGPLKVFAGYRVQHNAMRGPCMGRMELSESFDFDTARALAEQQTWKAALLDLPLGGSSGGICCDADHLSKKEWIELCRRFVARTFNILGPYHDVVACAPEASTLLNESLYHAFKERGGFSPAIMTGKPSECGGLPSRAEAVGGGLSTLAQKASQDIGLNPFRLRFSIVGHNRVTEAMVSSLQHAGGSLVAATGGNSLDVESQISADHVMASDCDVLILANRAIQVHQWNARRIKARLVLEACDLAISSAADRLLHDAGIAVIPDLVANSGALFCDYVEWSQNMEGKSRPHPYLSERLRRGMLRAYRSACDFAAKHKLPLRTAAYAIGMERVAAMEKLRVA